MTRFVNWKLFVSLVFIILLLPLLHNGLYQMHDAQANIARFAAYFKAFQDFQIPPRWAGDLNFRYGSPVFIFYYPLPGYLAAFLHFLRLNFENSFKLIIGFSFVSSFVTFYLWSSTFLKKNAAIIAALIYALAPYHLLDLYVRGDVAELLALAFVPLVLLMIDKTIKKSSFPTTIVGGVFYALLIISHNGISAMFSGIFVIYILIKAKNYKEILSCGLILLTGLALACFFWLPAVTEEVYVNAKLFIGDMYKSNFPTVASLIYSSWGFGSDVNKVGGLSPQIGIVPFFAAIISFTALIKGKRRKSVIFWFAIFIAFLFMTTSYSTFIWSKANFLKLLEFPWRLTAVSSFAAAVLVGYLCNILNSKLSLLLILIFLISIMPFTKVIPVYSAHSDNYYLTYTGITYYHGEASPRWTAGDFGSFPKKQLDIIGGFGTVSNIRRSTNKLTFAASSKNGLQILDNTVYFPGWQVTVNGRKVPIQFQDMNHRGLITFYLPGGKYTVIAKFTETPLRLLSDIISVVSLVLVVSILFIESRKEKRTRK